MFNKIQSAKFVVIFFTPFFLLAKVSTAQSYSLFNGQNLQGWHIDVPANDTAKNPINPFIVRNKMLVSIGTPQGHLITDSVYKNYRLVVEYRFPGKPGNCGILVHGSTPRALYKMFPKSLEVQMEHDNAGDFWCIVENIKVKNMKAQRGVKKDWGITEGKLRRIKNLTDSSEKKVGEWNMLTIECYKNSVRVWVNGDMVNDGFDCSASAGQIALQAEGSEVECRKFEISPISKLSKSGQYRTIY